MFEKKISFKGSYRKPNYERFRRLGLAFLRERFVETNFIEANKMLQFDRAQSFGMRLNIPSGDYVEFEPKSTKIVPLVKISGTRLVNRSQNIFIYDLLIGIICL